MNNKIIKLWEKHLKVTCPINDFNYEVIGINLFGLKERTENYISTYINSNGENLELKSQMGIDKCLIQCQSVIPELASDALIYTKRLAEMCQLVLNDSESKFPARLHVLVARDANNAIVIRRGPSKQVCTLNWNRNNHEFTIGQWLKKARIFERRSDISANGLYWIYFTINGKWNSETKGSWTGIAKVPWLKTLALYAKGDGWNGGGLFSYDNVYWLNDGYGHKKLYDSKLVKRNESYIPKENYGGECPHVYYNRLQRDGWKIIESKKLGKWRSHMIFEKEMVKGWVLRKVCHEETCSPEGKGCYWDEHEIENAQGEVSSHKDWEWAEWMDNAIFYAEFGVLYQISIQTCSKLSKPKIIHDFNDYKFEELKAPY